MNRQNHKEPMLNLEEPAPVYLAAMLILLHTIMTFVPSVGAYMREAFALVVWNGTVFGDRTIGSIPTLLTHVLVHANWEHVLINAGFIAIFGILAIRGVKNRGLPILGRFNRGGVVFFGLFLAGAIAGGLMQWLMWTLTHTPVGVAVGASTGETALFAAAGWVLGGKQRMLVFLMLVVGMDAFFIITKMGNPAWAGHLGGYLVGMILSPLWLKPESVGMSLFR